MGKRIRFDVRELLFPEQHESDTDSVVKLLTVSPLLPTIAQIYNESGKTVRVGKLGPIVSGTPAIRFNLVNRLGFMVGAVSSASSDSASFRTPWNPDSQVADRRGLSTSNPRYLTNKLKMSSGHPASSNLHHAIREANKFVGDKLRSVLDQMIDTNYGASISSMPQFKINALENATGTYIARVVAGEISLAEIPARVRSDFERVFNAFKENREKFAVSIAKGKEFLDSEKWVYFPNVNDGIVLGAVRPEPMLAALDKYSNGETLPFESDVHTYVQETVPLKWYKSFDCIPDELRAGLEYSLVMLKMHRASEDMLPKDEGAKFWQEMGAYTYNPSGNTSPFFLLAR